MTIDVHTHLWPADKTPGYLQAYFGQRGKANAIEQLSAEGLLAAMDEAGIDRSIVSALCFGPRYSNRDLRLFNNHVKQQVAQSPGRLAGFCTLNPMEEGAMAYLRQLIEDDGFRGLKLHGNMQEFYPDDPRLYPVYEAMQAYKLPILFHSGGIGLPPIRDCYGQPIRFDAVACDFPELPIILGHAGRIWYNETAMLLRKHRNVYADISTNIGKLEAAPEKPMAALLNEVSIWAGKSSQLLFGSDYPFYGQSATLRVLKGVDTGNASFTSQDIAGIAEHNAQQFCNQYHIFEK